MQWSHSRVECFEKCPFKYKMRYIDGITTDEPTDASNALVLGTALHTGIEKSVEEAIQQYFMSYPVIDDSHINEAIKLEFLIPKAKAVLPSGEYEVEIKDDDFHGFIDLLAPVKLFHDAEVPDVYDIYDFKYSNNTNHYKNSRQLHLYKYFFEKCNPGKKIRSINFLFVPKVNIKQKKTENLQQFRQRLWEELKNAEVKTLSVDFDYQARQAKLDIDEKNIYRFGMGFNSAQLGDGNITNIVIKSRYALLDLKCNKLEIRLKSFLKKLVKIVLSEINDEYETDYQVSDVYFEFEREVMTNAADNAQIDKTEAETEQVKLNTILNAAARLDNDTVLQAICELLELDFEDVKALVEQNPVVDLNTASEALANKPVEPDVPPEGDEGGVDE